MLKDLDALQESSASLQLTTNQTMVRFLPNSNHKSSLRASEESQGKGNPAPNSSWRSGSPLSLSIDLIAPDPPIRAPK